ncbi:MAG: recombination protein RecR [Marinilabiliales bacterium]|nr:MAG: recombination protein RecR [Marinilabiliales bacterium]
MNEYSSKLLENVVNELSRLPGIGKKTALRLALHILREEKSYANNLGNSIIKMREDIIFCEKCNNISDDILCGICSNHKRDENLICVVENTQDVIAIENTSQFNGLYHVLGGIISPVEGIGPNDLSIASLIKRINEEKTNEIILALPSTVEGDTTAYYLYKLLKDFEIDITTIAKGISIGEELEYADEITLGRSIINRHPFGK